jgi:DNA-binding sugar fermentation-stimulating protein
MPRMRQRRRAYRQVYEIYSEALVLQFLRTKALTQRIAEEDSSTPDFLCELENGKKFYVEVKSFDVVGGDIRRSGARSRTLDCRR